MEYNKDKPRRKWTSKNINCDKPNLEKRDKLTSVGKLNSTILKKYKTINHLYGAAFRKIYRNLWRKNILLHQLITQP